MGFSSRGGLPWWSVRMLGAEISHLQQQLRTRFPSSGGGPVVELTAALEAALWQKNVPVELSPDGQLAYRLAWSRNRDWRIGPNQVPAYKRVLDQLPTTIAIRSGNSTPPAVLVRESVGALHAHHTRHSSGGHHYDAVITAAITAARLEQVRMPVTLTDTTTELLHLLHDSTPDDAVLTDISRRIRRPMETSGEAPGRPGGR